MEDFDGAEVVIGLGLIVIIIMIAVSVFTTMTDQSSIKKQIEIKDVQFNKVRSYRVYCDDGVRYFIIVKQKPIELFVKEDEPIEKVEE